MQDHPGGDDLVLNYAGRDVTTVMSDPIEHAHSDSAFELLHEYQVGVIGAEEAIVNENFVLTEGFKPDDTSVADDFVRNKFLDLDRPLIMQVWQSDFSKSFYLQQVHQPRHLPHPARLFGPNFLEMFTRTPWYVVPMVWGPIAAFLFGKSVMDQVGSTGVEAVGKSLVLFFIGNFLWTVSRGGNLAYLVRS